jgi:hypothetical protein
MHEFRRDGKKTKPLNIICITAAVPTDPTTLEKEIVDCAKELDSLQAQERQIGVQFFHVGNNKRATDALVELDNCLREKCDVRAMVDTIRWTQMNHDGTVNGNALLKAVMMESWIGREILTRNSREVFEHNGMRTAGLLD